MVPYFEQMIFSESQGYNFFPCHDVSVYTSTLGSGCNLRKELQDITLISVV